MFDIKSLTILKGALRDSKNYSFVGIQRNKQTSGLEFWMPLGFEDFPDVGNAEHYGLAKKLFFGMYKSLKKFVASNRSVLNRTTNRDGVVSSESSSGFANENDETVLIYSKITMLDNVIDSYDELLILSVFDERSRTFNISYDRIDRYLHKAIYLEEDMIYIDEMHHVQKRIRYTVVDLIEMYCYIYYELKVELSEEEEVISEVKFLSESFKVKCLTMRTILFSEGDFASTIATMKDLLNKIEINTAYKDSSFWHFFSAVESFLYGETKFDGKDDGAVWGIHGFAYLWHDMCNDYIFRFYKEQDAKSILYADSSTHANRSIGRRQVYVDPEWETVPFYFELEGSNQSNRRYLRPDLVLRKSNINDFIEKEIEETFNPRIAKSHIRKLINISFQLTVLERKETFQRFIKGLNRYASRKQSTKSHRVSFEGYPESAYLEQLENYRKHARIRLLKVYERFGRRDIDITIVDYKYISHLYYEANSDSANENSKLTQDLRKQLTYELAVQQLSEDLEIQNQLWVPYYRKYSGGLNTHDMGEFIPVCSTGAAVKQSGIEIFKMDFIKLQEFYANSKD